MKDLLRCLHNKLQLRRIISEEDEVLLKLKFNIDLSLLRDDCTDTLKFTKMYFSLRGILNEEHNTYIDNLCLPTIDVKAHNYRMAQFHRLRKYIECLSEFSDDEMKIINTRLMNKDIRTALLHELEE